MRRPLSVLPAAFAALTACSSAAAMRFMIFALARTITTVPVMLGVTLALSAGLGPGYADALPQSVDQWVFSRSPEGHLRATVHADPAMAAGAFSAFGLSCTGEKRLKYVFTPRRAGARVDEVFVGCEDCATETFRLADNEARGEAAVAISKTLLKQYADFERYASPGTPMTVAFGTAGADYDSVFVVNGFPEVRKILLDACTRDDAASIGGHAGQQPGELASLLTGMNKQNCHAVAATLSSRRTYIYPLPQDPFLRSAQCTASNGTAYMALRKALGDARPIDIEAYGKAFGAGQERTRRLAAGAGKSRRDADAMVSVMLNSFIESGLPLGKAGLVSACLALLCAP